MFLLFFLTGHTPAAHAGKNAGGTLAVHTNDTYSYSAGTACSTIAAEPTSCEAAVTRTDKEAGAVVWLLAAFPAAASPGVSVIYFGITRVRFAKCSGVCS
jgi:hypothetical protein